MLRNWADQAMLEGQPFLGRRQRRKTPVRFTIDSLNRPSVHPFDNSILDRRSMSLHRLVDEQSVRSDTALEHRESDLAFTDKMREGAAHCPDLTRISWRITACQAVEDWEKEEKGDLSIKEGDILQILSTDADGWWTARDASGREGKVPSTFLRVVDPKDERIYQRPDDPTRMAVQSLDGGGVCSGAACPCHNSVDHSLFLPVWVPVKWVHESMKKSYQAEEARRAEAAGFVPTSVRRVFRLPASEDDSHRLQDKRETKQEQLPGNMTPKRAGGHSIESFGVRSGRFDAQKSDVVSWGKSDRVSRVKTRRMTKSRKMKTIEDGESTSVFSEKSDWMDESAASSVIVEDNDNNSRRLSDWDDDFEGREEEANANDANANDANANANDDYRPIDRIRRRAICRRWFRLRGGSDIYKYDGDDDNDDDDDSPINRIRRRAKRRGQRDNDDDDEIVKDFLDDVIDADVERSLKWLQ